MHQSFAQAPESLFRELLEAAPDAIVIVNAAGRIELVNGQLERMFGYSRQELLGKPVELLLLDRHRALYSSHREAYLGDPKRMLLGVGLGVQALRRDGTELSAEVSLSSLQSAQGLLVIATIRDVTQRVRTEKTSLPVDTSQELRTPLMALLGIADLLLEPELTEADRQSYAHAIRRNGEQLLSVLNELPDVAAVQPGKLTPSARPNNGRLVSKLADEPELGSLIESFVSALPAQMKAMSAAASGGDRTRLTTLAHQLKGAAGGYGFPSITEAAARVEQLVKSGGDSATALDALVALCQRASAGPASRSEPPPPAMPRVLVIDDSSDSQALIAARLRTERLELSGAMTAREGMKSAHVSPPDLIMLDLDLPDVSGLDVCRELKADPRTQNVPVLFLTGTEDPSVKAAALDLGAIDYVTKPFDPAELRARVRSALRTKRYHDLLAARAQLDGLTGLWNRGYFDKRLDGELSAALRHHHPLAVALIDLDHFKRLNDTYGHPFGDQILQAFASTLTRTVRASDVACRYGGEEFVVILRETSHADAERAGERIRSMVSELSMTSRGKQVGVTASVGVAALHKAAARAEVRPHADALVQAADSALYRAKHNGRNQVVVVNVD